MILNNLTPNTVSLNFARDVPPSIMWLYQRDPDTGNLYHYHPNNDRFDRWKFRLAELNNVHYGNVVDHTHEFYQNGDTQSQTIIDMVIDGSIHPISNGYVFYQRLDDNIHNVLFISSDTKRLDYIRTMRQMVMARILGGDNNTDPAEVKNGERQPVVDRFEPFTKDYLREVALLKVIPT